MNSRRRRDSSAISSWGSASAMGGHGPAYAIRRNGSTAIEGRATGAAAAVASSTAGGAYPCLVAMSLALLTTALGATLLQAMLGPRVVA